MDLEQVTKTLTALREQLLAEAREGAAAADTVELDQSKVGRLSRMDAMQGQAMAQAAQQRRQQTLRLIDVALRRVGEGTYEFCARCEEPINPRRLQADPVAMLCIVCAEQV